MYILKSESNDVYYNLALEEYLLNNFKEEFFIINSNSPSIILGVNQNAYEEINALYVKQSSIKVSRRISGGGPIFQDQGNLNFTYIYNDDGSDPYDFSRVTEIVSNFLKEKLNIDIEETDLNHLIIDGKKFGGYSKIKIDNRILLNGTLVFTANKKFLVDAYKLTKQRSHDRALRSTHDKVTSISQYLKEIITKEKFEDLAYNYIKQEFPKALVLELSKEDTESIKELIKDKYSTWEWIYGKEVVYNFTKTTHIKSLDIELFLQIENDRMKQVRIFGDFFSTKPKGELEEALTDCPYNKEDIDKIASQFNINDYIELINKDEFVSCFFDS